MRFIQRLFDHYRSYHAHGPLMLKYMSILGFAGYPAFYLLRFSKNTLPYDDLPIRILDAALCIVLFLKDRWPEKLKPYYYAYSYAVLIITLPFTFVFTSLKHGGGTIAVGNTLMAVFLLILLTDWRNMIVMLAAGFGSAILIYVLTDPNARMPVDYMARLPILAIVVVGGSVFKMAGERGAAARVRSVYASLAGSIAHEMRNPLGQLRHSLSNMQQALPMPTVAMRDQTLTAREIDELYRQLAQGELAVHRGLQVISMTLDEVNAKPLDTSGFVYLSAAETTAKAVREYGYQDEEERQRVSMEVREDFVFRGDETAYLFILFNLLKNALYYLAQYPEARVRISIGDHEVRVRDTGPGIAPNVLPQLFEPFRSVGKAGGTGLGLAYCQRVMRAFGGGITCNSELGEYTEFTMRFPGVKAEETAAHQEVVLQRARGVFLGKRLLVVDDDAALRMTTRHKLHALEAIIDEAADGQRALDMLSRQRYDLVVLDLNMPVLDGYALAQRIRQGQAPLNRNTCLVAYTGEPDHIASVKTHKAGMDGFVCKPCARLPLIQGLMYAFEHPSAAARQAAPLLEGMRVVLADDSAYNRRAIAASLRRAGATVLEAGHGQAVLDHVQAGACDAILMDLNMPGMDGLDATRAIRGGPSLYASVPIIALTAHSDAVSVQSAADAGMDDFITKPVDAAVLIDKLHALGLRSATATATATAAAGDGERPVPPVRPTIPNRLAAPAAVPRQVLLDLNRLEDYRRMGMLDELLDDYLPEISRLVDRLDEATRRGDLDASRDALHSLLGLTGEAGAQALYQLARSFYVPMVEQHAWPAVADWIGQIRGLSERTAEALHAQRVVPHAGDSPLA